MSYTISMDKAGRVVIPKSIRDRLGADETTRFHLEVVLDRIELTPKEASKPLPKVVEKDGVWVVEGMGKPRSSIVEAVRQDRGEREEHLLTSGASSGK